MTIINPFGSSAPHIQRPCLRTVEAIPVEADGARAVALRDPLGFAENVVVLPGVTPLVAAMFDGEHTLDQIKIALELRLNSTVDYATIRHLAENLDAACFLEGETFEAHKKNVIDEFNRCPTRESLLTGRSLPDDPTQIREQIDGFFAQAAGEGMAPLEASSLVAVISPHIDFERGASTYAHAYAPLAKSDADTFFIIGTLHAGESYEIALTEKSYRTPLGTCQTDTELVGHIAREIGVDFHQNQIAHRTEHSIELQVIMLQYLFGGKRDIRIVPILIGYFPVDGTVPTPENVEAITHLTKFLRDTLTERGSKAVLIAGADFAHVGSQFGDDLELTQEYLAEVQRADKTLIENRDAEGFYQANRSTGDRYRVCGTGAIYVLLKSLPSASGTLLQYRQCHTVEASSCVTVASMAFNRM